MVILLAVLSLRFTILLHLFYLPSFLLENLGIYRLLSVKVGGRTGFVRVLAEDFGFLVFLRVLEGVEAVLKLAWGVELVSLGLIGDLGLDWILLN